MSDSGRVIGQERERQYIDPRTGETHPTPGELPNYREVYCEGTRVYGDGHLIVDTYTGMRKAKECEQLAEWIVRNWPLTDAGEVERLRNQVFAVMLEHDGGGNQESQAAAWRAVFKALWDGGMCQFISSDGRGRTRALEFIRQLLAAQSALEVAERERVRSTAERLIRMTTGIAYDKYHPGSDGENHHALAVEVCKAMRELLRL